MKQLTVGHDEREPRLSSTSFHHQQAYVYNNTSRHDSRADSFSTVYANSLLTT